MIFCCYLLEMWAGLQACATLVCLLNDSTDQGSPWLLHYSVNLCIGCEDAPPQQMKPPPELSLRGVESQGRPRTPQCIRPYCTDTVWHAGRTRLLQRGKNVNAHAAANPPANSPPLRHSDWNQDEQHCQTKGKYHSRIYVSKHEGAKKSNEWYEWCQYTKAGGLCRLPCQLIPLAIFHQSAKSQYEVRRQNKIWATRYRSKIKQKTLHFPWRLTHWNLNVHTRFFCWGEAGSLHRIPTGSHFSSAVNWNILRQLLSIIIWQSPVMYFLVWRLMFTFNAGNQWEEDKLLICRQSQLLYITVSPKQIKTNKHHQSAQWSNHSTCLKSHTVQLKSKVTNKGLCQFIFEMNSFTLFFKSK